MTRIALWALWATLTAVAAAQCSFPDALLGNWTSSNYGMLTFAETSPQFVMNFGVDTSTSSTSFDCYLISGTQYILKSLATVPVFATTGVVYAYLCLDLREAGPNSYYYYQNSAKEVGFAGERIVGISEVVTDVSVNDVCTTSLDIAEFHTMVRKDSETEAVIQCADPLLLSGTYTYTDSTGTYCSGLNTSLVDSCSNNLTTIQFNDSLVTDSDCAALSPGWSATGYLGCVANVYDQNKTQHYVSLYNFDDTVDDTSTFRYTCAAVVSDMNGTVFMSLSPSDCIAGQNATDMPSGGSLMEISPVCVPETSEPDKDWTWLIILCICIFALILVIVLSLLICRYMALRKKRKAREREMLPDKHPLAEVSLRLDAPATLEKLPEAKILEVTEEMYSSPRSHIKEKPMKNPMPEPSLLLDLKQSKWSIVKERISTIAEDPFNEISKDEVVEVQPSRNRQSKNFWNFGRRPQKTAKPNLVPNSVPKHKPLLNGGLPKHKSVTNGGPPIHKPMPNGGLPNRHKTMNGTFVINRSKTALAEKEVPKIERAITNSFCGVAPISTHEEAQTQTLDNNLSNTNGVSLTTKNLTETTKETITSKCDKTADVDMLSPNDKQTAKKAETVPNKRGIRNINRHSLITWAGKRLVRSKSNISTRLTRGLTSTRVGSITEGKRNTNNGKQQRRQSESDTLPGNQKQPPDAVKQIKEPASAEGAFLTVETCEPLSQMALNNSPLVTELAGIQHQKIEQDAQTQKLDGAPSVQPQKTVTDTATNTSQDLNETKDWEDYVDNKVTNWLQTTETQTDTVDLNASFNGTYSSFLNIKSKTDLHKKTLRPSASKMPWR